MRDKITDHYGQEHTLPGPFHTLDMLKGANMAKGGRYFERGTMLFFNSRVAPGVIAGRIFITSEQDSSPYAESLAWDGQRRYTVRVMSDGGDVTDLGPDKDTFGAFATLREARAWVQRYLDGEAESYVAELGAAMNLYAIDEKETLAALQVHLSARAYHGHTVEDMFERITQHPAAMIASAVDECRAEPCPYCCSEPWEGCRPDCSSYFEER